MEEAKRKIADLGLLVAIPTYNNGGTIGQVVEQVRRYSDHVIVVNDGATDSTAEIIDRMGVANISYSPNRGKGYAIRKALRYASENGYRYLLTIDADGQHFASDIPLFLEEITSTPDALLVGARRLDAENMPSKNTFANKFSNFWYFVETGNKMEDTQSGYRLYPVKKMGKFRFFTSRYEFEIEVLVRAAWAGITVRNIPIAVFYPPQGERVSHFKPGKDFLRISLLNSLLVIIALLFYYPWRFMRALTKENIRTFIRRNITDTKESNARISSAIGLGVFFGIVPIWGYQMIAAGLTAHMLKLNKVLTLISSNISLPPMIPFIIYGSFYMGSLLMGRDMRFEFSDISIHSISYDLMQYILGSMVFAVVCGVIAFGISSLILFFSRRKKING